MADEVGVDQVAKVVTIAWALRHNRNEVRHGGEKKNGKSLVQRALNYIAKYNAAVVDANKAISVVEQAISWQPPHVNCYKIKVDGAIFPAQRVAWIVVLVRDDKGWVEVALCKKIMALMGAVEAKVKAFEVGLLFAKRHRHSRHYPQG